MRGNRQRENISNKAKITQFRNEKIYFNLGRETMNIYFSESLFNSSHENMNEESNQMEVS